MRYKVYSAKTHDKDKSILSPISINEADINENVTSDNVKECPWPEDLICIAGDSIASGFQPCLPSQKHKVKVKSFFGTKVRDLHGSIKPILQQKPEYNILH